MASVHTHISADHKLWDLKLGELIRYRDLILLYTKRSLTITYKQTILGPLWMVIGPFFTSVIHMVIFGQIAGFSTGGVPQLLFYLFGTAVWTFFSSIFTQTSDTFVSNAHLFGKVYFPRLAIPVSNVLVNLVRFGIQFFFGLCFMIYFRIRIGFTPALLHWLLIPFVLLWLAMLGTGFGILFSSMTTRYRDLRILVSFGVRLWMYVTPVVYALPELKTDTLRTLALINPVTAPVECMRWCLWGQTEIPLWNIFYSAAFAVVILLLGIIVFNKVERTFMDTV